MKTNSTARRTALGLAGAVMAAAALVPAAAQAQQYGNQYQYGGGYYDPCQRDQTGRTVAGALIGGLAGMALGNNVVNDQRRGRWGGTRDNDTGATVGALLGAGVGASVGRNSAGCAPQPRQQANRYNQPQYDYGYAPGYQYTPDYSYQYDPRYAQPQYDPRYAQPEYDYRYQEDYSSRYDNRGSCRMVESRIRMPDGRSQTRMVQACPDSQGRYQIVD